MAFSLIINRAQRVSCSRLAVLAMSALSGLMVCSPARADTDLPTIASLNATGAAQSVLLDTSGLSGTFSAYQVRVSWGGAINNAWSSDASFRLTSAGLVGGAIPGGTIVYADSGPGDGSAADTVAREVTWSGVFANAGNTFSAGGPLHLVFTQGVPGTQAMWSNVRITLISGLPPAPPSNDLCAGAITIPQAGPFPWLSPAASIVTASTSSVGDPVLCNAQARRTVWYTFTPATSGAYLFETCADAAPAGNVGDTIVGIYTAPACGGPYTLVACNDTSCGSRAVAGASLTAGTTYYIVLGRVGTGQLPGNESTLQMRVRPLVSPAATFEIEPNDTRAQSNAVALAPGGSIAGLTTGTSSAPGISSIDFFRLTLPDAPGITRWRLSLESLTPSQTVAIRGLNQNSSPNGRIIGTSSIIAQRSSTLTSPANFVQAYTFGGAAREITLSVSGSAATFQTYAITLSDPVSVAPVAVPGAFRPSAITLSTVGQTGANQTDTDLWVYDATTLSPIAGFGNDDRRTPSDLGSSLTRTFAPGRYLLVISDADLSNNQASPGDDGWLGGVVLEFPGVVLCSSDATGRDVSLTIADADGARSVSLTKGGAFDVRFAEFVVDAACSPADIANTDGDPQPDGVIDNSDFGLFFQAFFLPEAEPARLIADIANTDGDTALTGGGPDGSIDNGDFAAFFSLFFTGCPVG
ncbi:MAG: GC-type dockerin domain-anchored protein [Phycisphaerales bacterium]